MSSSEGRPKVYNRTPEEAVKGRIEKGRTTKERLFTIIAASEDGKSSAELRSEMKLSRDRIHAICKEYMDEGMMYKTGRYGKYRLTPKAFGDQAKKGFFFGSKIMKSFSSFDNLSATNIFCNTSYINGIRSGKSNIPNRDRNIVEKLDLFEFALGMGAITTFEMLMAIKFASEDSDANTKDSLAWKWIDNVIHPSLILKAFREISSVSKGLKRNKSEGIPQGPFNDMDSEHLQTLLQSFKDVFPEVHEKSEEILSGLQSRIDSERRHANERFDWQRRMELEDLKHTKCGGQLKSEIRTNLEGRYVQQCTKCHRWIKVRKPKQINQS